MLEYLCERYRTLTLTSERFDQRDAGVFTRVLDVKLQVAHRDAAAAGIVDE